tara:strand:- start:619 stop:1470 length:852 start_codon:yes stop_codon:yes gene_type:complete
MGKYIILIFCKDKQGIIADFTQSIYSNNGNITYIDQYVDKENNNFFMRIETEFNSISDFKKFNLFFVNGPVKKYNINYDISLKDYNSKVGIYVSKYNHCLYDIISRTKSDELQIEISFIISNHIDLKNIADKFSIPFYHIPVSKSNKLNAEKKQLDILNKYNPDLIILARYMQILEDKVISNFKNKIINIHHSFLPAFPGGRPYHKAFERGVKIIGATSHYVTNELDGGPIIEQDIIRISHIHNIESLINKGKDLEKVVLSRAIKLHIEKKILVHLNKTVIFN